MIRTHNSNGTIAEKQFFRKYSNKFTKLQALSKKLHYALEFAKNRKTERKTWEIIRSVLPNKQNSEPLIPLVINDHPVSRPKNHS